MMNIMREIGEMMKNILVIFIVARVWFWAMKMLLPRGLRKMMKKTLKYEIRFYKWVGRTIFRTVRFMLRPIKNLIVKQATSQYEKFQKAREIKALQSQELPENVIDFSKHKQAQ